MVVVFDCHSRVHLLALVENKYKDAYEIQHDLRARKVKGALMDGYMAGSYNELFEDEHIRVREIIDYNNGYGIVLGGIHHRLQRCFKKFVKRKRTFIVDYVASQIKTVKVNYFLGFSYICFLFPSVFNCSC